MWPLFGVMVLHRSIFHQCGWYMYPQYMCILLYVKLIWCICITEIYCQLEWSDVCILSICAFSDMWKLFGVMVFRRSIVNWSGDRCILSICAFCYMWNLFGVTVFHTSFVNWSVEGRCVLSIYAFCYIWNLFGVMLFHRSIGIWSEG